MAAMIAIPVVAFVLLMTMALYEDRILPGSRPLDAPPAPEPAEPEDESAPRPAPHEPERHRHPRGRHCVRQSAAPRAVRSHEPPAAGRRIVTSRRADTTAAAPGGPTGSA